MVMVATDGGDGAAVVSSTVASRCGEGLTFKLLNYFALLRMLEYFLSQIRVFGEWRWLAGDIKKGGWWLVVGACLEITPSHATNGGEEREKFLTIRKLSLKAIVSTAKGGEYWTFDADAVRSLPWLSLKAAAVRSLPWLSLKVVANVLLPEVREKEAS
ncbi:hypothetical protein PIB30_054518 [Stylosanthes scabra]|uniref:Uncharacterized protein n=1 Tax=Stylosanthes scabra TaxID=79078 RepID=A0ABU6VKT9_9FABA|nr:hypothetical protein [Stylosanthes scabra]